MAQIIPIRPLARVLEFRPEPEHQMAPELTGLEFEQAERLSVGALDKFAELRSYCADVGHPAEGE